MLKNINELNGMREAGKLASEVLEMIGDFVKPGISTGELDKICHDYIVDVQNAIPANVGYRGFEKLSAPVSIKLFVMEFRMRTES